MSSIRWGVIAAIIALFISVLLGIISGVAPFYIFLRGIVFTILFFGIGFALRFMVNSFFPELLYMDDESAAAESYEQSGARVNITLDSTGEYAVPELFKTSKDDGELGNIEDLISGNFQPGSGQSEHLSSAGIDAGQEEEYNEEAGFTNFQDNAFDIKDVSDFDKAPVEKPTFTPSFGDDEGLGGLPDLDAMMTAFSSVGGDSVPMGFGGASPSAFGADDSGSPPATKSEPDRSQYKGNKPATLEGGFNPKELAEGIRTVLNKDN